MDDISDAGGVAARIGFKYQDHVAASFVLEMIGDPRIVQVECETSDDITRMLRFEGREFPEYVQVKTTDRDKNWTATEISSRATRMHRPRSSRSRCSQISMVPEPDSES